MTMACSAKAAGLCFYGLNDVAFGSKEKWVSGIYFPTCKVQESRNFPAMDVDFKGKSLFDSDPKGSSVWNVKGPGRFSVKAQASICIGRAQRWWEKALKPNMVEIHSPQELVDSLVAAGDRLAIVDFYSPGCGGCRALHPKICQLAEQNPNAIFLKVNYEELKSMCHSLHIHVLPFFRFYRGAEGRLCSFSCTNATIKKFKDALAKYGVADRCCSGAAKGLDESELLKLASAGLMTLDSPVKSMKKELRVNDIVMNNTDSFVSLNKMLKANEEDALLKI